MNQGGIIYRFMHVHLLLALLVLFIAQETNAQQGDNGPNAKALFTKSGILVDGVMEKDWEKSSPSKIAIAMLPDLSAAATDAKASGEFRTLWDGSLLYILIQVKDPEINNTSARITEKDGVDIYLDLYNDKYPKYEEDDGILKLGSDAARTVQGTNTDRFEKSAVATWKDEQGVVIGYIVEAAINIGGLPQANGTKIGFEIGINDVAKETNRMKNRIFWSSGKNNGINDNSHWGTIVLNGYDGKSPKALDTYMLKSNIAKAKTLANGIWQDEKAVQQSLANAEQALAGNSQQKINESNAALDKALKNLRRKGPLKDPKEYAVQNSLPDPFKFQNGTAVKSAADWTKRAAEIKALAQYYEYGTMPAKPEKLTATLEGDKIKISIEDKGKKAEFEAQLTLPADTQTSKKGPYPVIVSIDFGLTRGNPVYLRGGYAVLSLRYASVGSDNFEHKGAFYDLYPYDVTTGNDAGTLLTWAWGASRCVDALEYLSQQKNQTVSNLDISKLAVTGFSRCGKAALAAGLFDERFDIVSPGASGAGGAAVYRYASFAGKPFGKGPVYGHEYSWGTSPGCEVMSDKIRHQGHNSNEMLARFLNSPRIYQTNTYGYGERLPYDHHEIIAAIAPRAVLITTATDDYANNAEGDAIGYEAAKKVYEFLAVPDKIGLNLRNGEVNPRGPGGGGHWLSESQMRNLVAYADYIFYETPLPEKTKSIIYSNPYLPTFDKYFGGIKSMMPWAVPKDISRL